MLTLDDLKKYHTGFELLDPFGRGRMRELLYDYRLQKVKDQSRIDELKEAYETQGKTVERLVKMKIAPNNELKERIAQLEGDLEYANLTIDSLTKWAESLEKCCRENGIKLPGDKEIA